MAVSPRKTGTRTTAKKPAAAKAQASAQTDIAAVEAENLRASAIGDAASELRKKELIELVVARCDVKKRDAKPAVEAALAVLGEALKAGREVNLQPMGKIKIKRSKQVGNAQISTLHLRQNNATRSGGKDPLAQTGD
ncbi:HU family DNA-binding protein [Primorskyibacter marinus]|uniref:HU family DNA-binding protein n=1 Tax=Primorskyibacter marinus TaxID=1977320 RepID=UPI000E3076F1|nr:HU family DNA-binding protein [Primorskyibacter marinus]